MATYERVNGVIICRPNGKPAKAAGKKPKADKKSEK